MRRLSIYTMAVAAVTILLAVSIPVQDADAYVPCSDTTADVLSGGSEDVSAMYFSLELDSTKVKLLSGSWDAGILAKSLLSDVNVSGNEGVCSFDGSEEVSKNTRLAQLTFGCLAQGSHKVIVTVMYSHSDHSKTSETLELSVSSDHSLRYHPYKGATETAEGNTAYWECSKCGKYFSDSDGNIEIRKGSWVIPKIQPRPEPPEVVGPVEESDEGSIVVPQEVLDDRDATAEDTELVIAEVEMKDLSEAQRAAIGSNYAVDINLSIKGVFVHDFGTMTLVKLNFPPVEGKDMSKTLVRYVAVDGSTEDMATWYSNGVITFETTHLSIFMVVLSDYTPPGDNDLPDDEGSDDGLPAGILATIGAAAIVSILIVAALAIRKRRNDKGECYDIWKC